VHWTTLEGYVLAGCASTADVRGCPLYSGARRPRADVAELLGPVALVDGAEVPSGIGAFELLPGCHLVRTIEQTMPNPGAGDVLASFRPGCSPSQ
jgi:hypothetical protein